MYKIKRALLWSVVVLTAIPGIFFLTAGVAAINELDDMDDRAEY